MFETIRKFTSKSFDDSTQVLIKNSGLLVFSGTITSILATIQAIIIARFLGVTQYGYLALIIASAGFIFQFADFRTWEVAIKYLPSMKKESNNRVADLIFSLIFLDIVSGILSFFVVVLLHTWLANAIAHESAIAPLLLLYAFCLPMSQISLGTSVGLLRSFDRFNLLVIKNIFIAIIQLLGIIVVLYMSFGLQGVIATFVVTEAVGAGLSIYFIFRVLNEEKIHQKPNIDALKILYQLRGFIFQVWLSGTILGVQNRANIVLLGAFTTPTAVGHYRFAFDLANLFEKVGHPIQNAIFPILVELNSKGEFKEANKLVIRTSIFIGIVIMIPLFVTILFPTLILNLVAGPDFIAAKIPLIVLVLGIGIHTIFIWTRSLLVSKSLLKLVNGIWFSFFLIELVLFLVLVPKYAAIGAAVAKASVYIFRAFLAAFIAIKLEQ